MARLVTYGCTGLDVKELQAALNFHIRKSGTPLVPDGIFGPLTDARLREFQRLVGTTDDGDAGPITVGALYRTLRVPVEAVVSDSQSTGRQGFASAAPRPEGPEPPPRVPFPPPLPPIPQVRRTSSEGFDLQTKLTLDPFAKRGEGSRLKLSLKLDLPWPTILPKPLKLDLDASLPGTDPVQLDAKLTMPFEIKINRRLELTPYFYTGAGMSQYHYRDLNAGAGASVKLKIFRNIFRTGVDVSLEADGGVKFLLPTGGGNTEVKGYFEGGIVLERRFGLPF